MTLCLTFMLIDKIINNSINQRFPLSKGLWPIENEKLHRAASLKDQPTFNSCPLFLAE